MPRRRGREGDAMVCSCVKFGLVAWGFLQVPSRDLVAVLVGPCRVIDISSMQRVGIGSFSGKWECRKRCKLVLVYDGGQGVGGTCRDLVSG